VVLNEECLIALIAKATRGRSVVLLVPK